MRDRVTPELELIAAGAAAGLGTIDVVYVARGRIRFTYLIDAAVQAGLLYGLAKRTAIPHGSRTSSPSPSS